jgi:anti-sigma factor RsiW
MSCSQAQLVSRYHDGELSPEAARTFETHLEACAECRGELESLRAIGHELRTLAMPLPGDAAMARWAESVASRVQEQGVLRLAGWMTAAAAAVLVFATVRPSLLSEPTASVALSQPVVSEWEVAALAGQDEPATVVAARWMAADLSAGREGVSP